MAGNTSGAMQLEERRVLVAELYLQGWVQTAIAKQLGVTQPTVSADLKAIRQEWKESRIRDFDTLKAQELERLDKIERTAWEAWEQSREPEITTKASKVDGQSRAERTTKHTHGNVNFLNTVIRCVDKRCDLLGLDAPFKVTQTDVDGNDLTAEQGRAEFDRIVALLRQRSGETAANNGHAGNGSNGSAAGRKEQGP